MIKNFRFKIRPEDILLASFPRSGNSWVKTILAYLLIQQEKMGVKFDFEAPVRLIPYDFDLWKKDLTLEDWQSGSYLRKLPVIVKSHKEYKRSFKRSIYILRDPRDVVVSFWYFYKYKKGAKFGSFSNFFRYATVEWCRHVKSWQDKWSVMVTYEKLQQDPFREIKKITDFLDLGIRDSAIRKAVKASSFETIQKLEKKFRQKEGRNHRDARYFLLRQGKSGQWKKYLKATDIEFMRRQIKKYKLGPFLEKQGYIF